MTLLHRQTIANFKAQSQTKKAFNKESPVDWQPIPNSPQALAFYHSAFETLYGGQAGGGKSALVVGLSLCSQHKSSLILRREFAQLQGFKKEFQKLIPGYGGGALVRHGDRTIELGGCQYVSDWRKYKGREHSLKAFDELSEFAETQYVSIIGWTRSPNPLEPCRVLSTSNPPDDNSSQWMLDRWSPWLSDKHPNPAKSGEIRYFVRSLGETAEEIETPDALPVDFDGQLVTPKSRTFIRASVKDNPYLMATGYDQTLLSLPEPLRSRLARGDFTAGMEDNIYQIIPTAWIKSAQTRWTPNPSSRQDCIAADVARGGNDAFAVAWRHRDWVNVAKRAGKLTPDAQTGAQFLLSHRLDNSIIHVDIIGVGASLFDFLKEARHSPIPINASTTTDERDRTKQLNFTNLRAWMWWNMRELLDPAYGSTLALPPGGEVLADLSAPHWKLMLRGIQVEDKDEIKKRLGRSPDIGDAICMACLIPKRRSQSMPPSNLLQPF